MLSLVWENFVLHMCLVTYENLVCWAIKTGASLHLAPASVMNGYGPVLKSLFFFTSSSRFSYLYKEIGTRNVDSYGMAHDGNSHCVLRWRTSQHHVTITNAKRYPHEALMTEIETDWNLFWSRSRTVTVTWSDNMNTFGWLRSGLDWDRQLW